MAKPWRIGVWSSTGEFIIRPSSFASSSHHIVCIYTNSEESLLLDETADNVDKALVAATVVHEAAHQWFGNLVTSTWWDDIWLNEGMTTLFESIILAEVICWYFGCSRGINNYVETFLKKGGARRRVQNGDARFLARSYEERFTRRIAPTQRSRYRFPRNRRQV